MRQLCLAGLVLCCSALTARGQGLIWSLPEDGTEVKYEGTYRQTDYTEGQAKELGGLTTLSDDAAAQPPQNPGWKRELTIRSVGTEQAEFRGSKTACRWIEFELVTAPVIDAQAAPGPGGKIIYKVLVPESRIQGKLVDDDGIFNEFLPIVRGYRRFFTDVANNQYKDSQLDSGVLQIYPSISLLMPYRNYESQGNEDPGSTVATSAEKVSSKLTIESRGVITADGATAGTPEQSPVSTQVQSVATLWKSDSVPFGVAKWKVEQTRRQKSVTAPRTAYDDDASIVTKVVVEMIATATNTDVQSALPDAK